MPLVNKLDEMHVQRQWDNMATIRMYDPPVNGKTPADGEGLPRTSPFYLRDRESKQAQGFTLAIVGWDGDWPVLGDGFVSPSDHGFVERYAPEEAKAIVAEKRTRKREIKR